MSTPNQNPAIRGNRGTESESTLQRNPDGTFPKGVSGNPSGRPKGTLKDYLRQKFCSMSDEEKEIFLSGVSPFDQFRMAEGNPHTTTDVTSGNEKLGPTLSEAEKAALLALLNEPSKS